MTVKMNEIYKKLKSSLFLDSNKSIILKFPIFLKAKMLKNQEFVFHSLPLKDDCCNVTRNTVNDFFNAANNTKTTYKEELGRATWRLLHAIAENYPEKPNKHEKANTKQFIYLLANLFPCEDCKEGFKKILSKHPPIVTDRNSLCIYICNIHNIVNQKIGKNVVDCNELYR